MVQEALSSHTAHQLVFPLPQQDLHNHMVKDLISRISIKDSIKVPLVGTHLKVVMVLPVRDMGLLTHLNSPRDTLRILIMDLPLQHLLATTPHQLIQGLGILHQQFSSLMLLLAVLLLLVAPILYGRHLSPPTQVILPILHHNLAPIILMLV